MSEMVEVKVAELEHWRPALGYFDYEVSNKGLIRRSGRIGFRGRKIPPRNLSQRYDKSGYLRVKIGGKWRVAHRIVCASFHSESKDMQVNHINGIKDDNRPENLEWCTASENAKHACNAGLWDRRGGMESRSFKGWVEAKSPSVGYLLRGHLDLIDFGFDPSTVTKCISGSRKSHRGFLFSRIEESETAQVPKELVQ